MRKTVDNLTADDFRRWRVWEFCNDDTPDETAMSPVESLPVDDLTGRVVSCEFTLANQTRVFGALSNVDLKSLRRTRQFLLLSVFKKTGGGNFCLARSFDNDPQHDPAHFAEFLGLTLADVFPISYDISDVVNGPDAIVRGQIPATPIEPLSDSDREEADIRVSSGNTCLSPNASPPNNSLRASKFVQPDEVLAAIIGPEQVARNEVTEKVLNYAIAQGLLTAQANTKINADEKLRVLFDGKESISLFELTKYIVPHAKAVVE